MRNISKKIKRRGGRKLIVQQHINNLRDRVNFFHLFLRNAIIYGNILENSLLSMAENKYVQLMAHLLLSYTGEYFRDSFLCFGLS